MRILMSSHFFYPSIGGIETVSMILAHEFTAMGHDLTVVTRTLNVQPDTLPFKIVRRPSSSTLLKLVKECDVYFQSNVSLQAAWPLLLVSRPWVVTHHTWISRANGAVSVVDRLKRISLRHAKNISVSRAIAAHLPVPSTVIENPYQDDVFQELPSVARERELVFLG